MATKSLISVAVLLANVGCDGAFDVRRQSLDAGSYLDASSPPDASEPPLACAPVRERQCNSHSRDFFEVGFRENSSVSETGDLVERHLETLAVRKGVNEWNGRWYTQVDFRDEYGTGSLSFETSKPVLFAGFGSCRLLLQMYSEDRFCASGKYAPIFENVIRDESDGRLLVVEYKYVTLLPGGVVQLNQSLTPELQIRWQDGVCGESVDVPELVIATSEGDFRARAGEMAPVAVGGDCFRVFASALSPAEADCGQASFAVVRADLIEGL